MARMVISPPQGAPQLPDLPNWSWHEYGMRVAFWRLRAMFERVGAKPTVAINAKICETYHAVVQACIDSGWELNAHSYEQIPMHKLDDQRTSSTRPCGDREVLRQASARLVRTWPHADARYRSTISPKPAWNISATMCWMTIPSR